MKPESIEKTRARRKRGAVVSVVIFCVLTLLFAGAFGAVSLLADLPTWLRVVFGLLALGNLLSLPSVVPLLKERWNEIEGGELDAAGKY